MATNGNLSITLKMMMTMTMDPLMMMAVIMVTHLSPLNPTWAIIWIMNPLYLYLNQETIKKKAGDQDHMETMLFTNAPRQAEHPYLLSS